MSHSEKSTEQKLIATVKSLLLITLLIYAAWLTAQLIWFVLNDNQGRVMSVSSPDRAVSSSNSNKYRKVSGLHLFGKEGAAPVVIKDTPKQAPKTRLRLKLKGVFTAEQPSESGAIVEEQGKKTDYYKVGDTLPGNAILEEVYSDRILLRRSGQLETLYFDEENNAPANRIAEGPKKQTKPKQNQRPRIESPEQFMQEATKRLAENPEEALGAVGLKASSEGYVYQGNNPMLSGLNLKKGDVIRSVNGHNLGDIKRDKALMQSLYEQGSLDVEVVRDGASFYVNYPLR